MIKVKISHRELMRHVKFWLFVLPVVLGFLCFSAYPLIRSLTLSFTDAPLIPDPDYPAQFIGFENFVRIFTIDMTLNFGPALLYTLIYAVIHVPVIMAISLGLALILNKKLPCSGFFRVVFYLPALLPAVGMSIMFRWLFTPSSDGFINSWLQSVGVENPPIWLGPGSGGLGLFTILIMSLWGFGSKMIIFLAALKNVPKDLYEAASLDGATAWQQFWKITLPMISPIFFYNLMLTVIAALQVFNESLIVGGTTKETTFVVLYIYNTAYTGANPRLGYASALAWVLFLVIGVFTMIQFAIKKKLAYYEN